VKGGIQCLVLLKKGDPGLVLQTNEVQEGEGKCRRGVWAFIWKISTRIIESTAVDDDGEGGGFRKLTRRNDHDFLGEDKDGGEKKKVWNSRVQVAVDFHTRGRSGKQAQVRDGGSPGQPTYTQKAFGLEVVGGKGDKETPWRGHQLKGGESPVTKPKIHRLLRKYKISLCESGRKGSKKEIPSRVKCAETVAGRLEGS